jgi:hypothetical protein
MSIGGRRSPIGLPILFGKEWGRGNVGRTGGALQRHRLDGCSNPLHLEPFRGEDPRSSSPVRYTRRVSKKDRGVDVYPCEFLILVRS